MESIRRTYTHCIKPVPSPEFWTRTEFSKPDPPIIKRPIGRPKVHNRQKDPAKPLMQEGKLKRSFIVSCSKCDEKGHNYKTFTDCASSVTICSPTRDASSSQPDNSTNLTLNPTVVGSLAPSNPPMPPAPARVTKFIFVISPLGPTATQTRPLAPTIGRLFKPPEKANETGRPQQSRFRPKQKIFRPLAPIAACTIPSAAPNQEVPPPNLPASSKTKDSTE
ncbi:hypothetical protein Ahy_A10g047160 isoform A [Arachis hypogaea]|uniref:Uncharacterized protein n=1 Tax=Arachis hypogaea TaxID=3818 RepID=A0A445B1Q9_ARAHY|nr:hypothetical protein Ahy_A10g047160 isoform A [Arachis hypogaea]